ncbi:MAG: hypothetical protein IVW55_09990 [Chloroflexi bacterium]|nr:hypothetical protein [Chloroflexota bacterium]
MLIRRRPSLASLALRRAGRVLLALVILAASLGAATAPGIFNGPAPVRAQTVTVASDREIFGMVIRDPFYEYNTDPVNYHEAPNRTALEQQAKELAAAGVRWIRMEFFADYDGTVPAGDINWSKYDWFINELAPKYNLKILALLNVGMVSFDGKTVRPISLNDPADGGGSDPGDGSNHFIRVFTGRAQTIAARYGNAISAYEIINEPNISFDLWQDTRNGSAEMKPDRYAALLTSAYRAIKGVSPQSQVITGGMLIGSPPEGKNHDQFDYLYQLYVSPWVKRYQETESSRPGFSQVPWDGIALHPYFLEPDKLFAILKDFARKLQDRGDYNSKLWITEIGAQAAPPENPGDPPTADEINQAGYLRAVYSGILGDSELKAAVAHVFWFKYEDFVPGNYTYNYGLVRLLETPDGKNYSPSGKVWVHKLAYKVYQELALGYSPTDPVDAQAALADNQLYFSETQQAIAPQFAEYWQEKGGLERFGYPISRPVITNNGFLSQFFQRAVFEYHPENAGTPNEVLLRLLGDEITQGMKFDTANPNNIPPDALYFPQTKHSLTGAFRNFWEQTGGLAVYGYPISEEISEVSPTDGQTYLVQYFERNRFEYHPEAVGTPYEVQLGLLGSNMLKNDLWWR